jgi:hypothetical protein
MTEFREATSGLLLPVQPPKPIEPTPLEIACRLLSEWADRECKCCTILCIHERTSTFLVANGGYRDVKS